MKNITQIRAELPKMLDAFMSNSYLIPSTHTDYLVFTDSDELYRTYANDGRDYLSVEIKKGDERIHACTASKSGGVWSIQGQNLFTAKTVKNQLTTHYKYIKKVFEEIHSLNPDAIRLKEIRKNISEKRKDILRLEQEISTLQKEIQDSKKLPLKSTSSPTPEGGAE